MVLPSASVLQNSLDLSKRLEFPVELILPEILFDPFTESVLASGSIIEGFYNSYSDLDILIIGDYRQVGSQARPFYVAGMKRWVDITRISEREVRAIVARLHPSSLEEWHAPPALSLQEYDIAHRVKLAIPLTNLASELCLDIRELLVGSSLCHSLCHSFIRAARARWYDAMGAFTSSQFRQALHVMEICHSLTVDGMLALLGQTNPSEKWRLAKINRAAEEMREKGVNLNPNRPPNDFQQLMRETAALLFEVTALYHGRAIQTLSPPERATSRYEHTLSGIFIVHADGRKDLISSRESNVPVC